MCVENICVFNFHKSLVTMKVFEQRNFLNYGRMDDNNNKNGFKAWEKIHVF